MNRESLRASIDGLRAELTQDCPTNEATRERLLGLVSDLERALSDDEEGPPEETILDSVKDAIEQLELEHPRATSLLNRIMLSLGSGGI